MIRNAQRGQFITLEGIDGAGKSTHAAWLVEALRARGLGVVATREPGGTRIGEALRELLLRQPMAHDSEALLMFAARREHVLQVIEPALARGDLVLCDRYTDATWAYQGGGHRVSRALIADLERHVHAGCNPDLTLLFDVPSSMARDRLERMRALGRELDKFEQEDPGFFDRVRDAYLERAAAEPSRFRVIDAGRPLAEVRAELARIVSAL
ncbi:MAG TPA: dTMP kinase [Casimicrobiaceae bacterium]|nr:dTMP kinase [Casimicrobiaceae bacterium]